jgi:uncharacterized protein with HEPN domain
VSAARSLALIDDALLHLEVLHDHVTELGMHQPAGFDATCLRLSAAIDCVTRLPRGLQDAVCGEERSSIRAMRNRIAHGYFSVDRDAVRDTVTHDLAPFEARLRELRGVLGGAS